MPKTPISYYGGKQNMLKHILPNIPEHQIYTEAFFGGGAVYFAKDPSTSEIINDSNAMVINFYKMVQRDFLSLKAKIEATLFSRATYTVATTIYIMPHLFTELQQAWAFYVATNMGFSSKIGSWGFDKYGKRNKTFLNRKLNFDPSICDRLEHTQIECADALRVIKTYDCADAFHYIDPPYIDTHMGHYGGYSKDDYKALLDTLSALKGKFLLSGFPNEMLEEYIQRNHWNIKSFEKPKTAAKATLGKPRTARKTEVLVANYTLQ